MFSSHPIEQELYGFPYFSITAGPFKGELSFLLLLGFSGEDEPLGQFDLDDDLAAFCALGKGDHDALGQVFADLNGEAAAVVSRGGDVEAVDADRFSDRFEDIGAGAAGEGNDRIGKLEGLKS